MAMLAVSYSNAVRSLLQSGDYILVGGYSPICKGTCIRLETKISHRQVSSCYRSVPLPLLLAFTDGEGRDTCTSLVRKAMISLCSRKWPICILVEPSILILISVALYGEPGSTMGASPSTCYPDQESTPQPHPCPRSSNVCVRSPRRGI